MEAREMFEELGFEMLTKKNDDIPRKSWNYNEKHITYYNKGFYNMVIKFYIRSKIYETIKFISCDDDDRCHRIGLRTHQAIHQQMKELCWL